MVSPTLFCNWTMSISVSHPFVDHRWSRGPSLNYPSHCQPPTNMQWGWPDSESRAILGAIPWNWSLSAAPVTCTALTNWSVRPSQFGLFQSAEKSSHFPTIVHHRRSWEGSCYFRILWIQNSIWTCHEDNVNNNLNLRQELLFFFPEYLTTTVLSIQ